MNIYQASWSMSRGLTLYLKQFNLGDGGYNDKSFTLPIIARLSITLPNIKNRRDAVRYHDLHHVLTEYETGYIGEAEIGAWELASGCGKYYSAWILNISAFLYGLIICPKRVYRAYLRGRKCKNLYHGFEYDQILTVSIGEMRRVLEISINNG